MLGGHVAATRRVVHIDMDAFYAAVEQLDHPEYEKGERGGTYGPV
jgi:hypothetical protein